jgi:hypothetical protein
MKDSAPWSYLVMIMQQNFRRNNGDMEQTIKQAVENKHGSLAEHLYLQVK